MSTNPDIAKKYARALFRATHEEKFADSIAKDLEALKVVLTEAPSAFSYIKSPVHNKAARDKLIEQVSQQLNLHQNTINFLKIIAYNNRLDILESIIAQYWNLLREANNEQLVEVVSTTKMTKQQIAEIRSFMEDKLQKKVLIENIQDSSILGGLIIKVNSLVIDNSISNKLNNIKLYCAQV